MKNIEEVVSKVSTIVDIKDFCDAVADKAMNVAKTMMPVGIVGVVGIFAAAAVEDFTIAAFAFACLATFVAPAFVYAVACAATDFCRYIGGGKGIGEVDVERMACHF